MSMILNPYAFSGAAPPPPPPGDPSFVAASGPVSNANVTAPAGIAAGDLLIAYIKDYTTTTTTPAGWTKIGTDFVWTGYNYRSAAFYKVAVSGDIGADWDFGTGSLHTGFMVAYRNASTVASYGSYERSDTNPITLTGIACSDGQMLVSLVHKRDNPTGQSYTHPAGMTERLDALSQYSVHGCADLLEADGSNRVWNCSFHTFPHVGINLVIE